MSDPIIKLDLHGMRQEEAIRIIDRALFSASPATYQLHLIHGYHRGTSLRTLIYDWYQNDDRIGVPLIEIPYTVETYEDTKSILERNDVFLH